MLMEKKLFDIKKIKKITRKAIPEDFIWIAFIFGIIPMFFVLLQPILHFDYFKYNLNYFAIVLMIIGIASTITYICTIMESNIDKYIIVQYKNKFDQYVEDNNHIFVSQKLIGEEIISSRIEINDDKIKINKFFYISVDKERISNVLHHHSIYEKYFINIIVFDIPQKIMAVLTFR